MHHVDEKLAEIKTKLAKVRGRSLTLDERSDMATHLAEDILELSHLLETKKEKKREDLLFRTHSRSSWQRIYDSSSR